MNDPRLKERRHIDKCGKEVFRQGERRLLMRGHRTGCRNGCGNGGDKVSALQVSVAFLSGGMSRRESGELFSKSTGEAANRLQITTLRKIMFSVGCGILSEIAVISLRIERPILAASR